MYEGSPQIMFSFLASFNAVSLWPLNLGLIIPVQSDCVWKVDMARRKVTKVVGHIVEESEGWLIQYPETLLPKYCPSHRRKGIQKQEGTVIHFFQGHF